LTIVPKYLLCLGFYAVAIFACGGGSDGDDTTSTRGTATGSDDCEPSRGLSESCCEDLGIDACGAGLFCAAFDGRTVATCYPDGIRQPGQECAADGHCISKSCHVDQHRCLGMPGTACEVGLGCSDVVMGGGIWSCAPSSLLCEANIGANDTPCDSAAECASQICTDGTCRKMEQPPDPLRPCNQACDSCDPALGACSACLEMQFSLNAACAAPAISSCQTLLVCDDFMTCVRSGMTPAACASANQGAADYFYEQMVNACANCD
jgi:hypothetical protein